MWVWLNCAWCMDMTSPSQTKTQKEEPKLFEVCHIICFDSVVDHREEAYLLLSGPLKGQYTCFSLPPGITWLGFGDGR